MEEDTKRITVRISPQLWRTVAQEAQQAGLDFSKYLRRLLFERKRHWGAFDQVGKIMRAAAGVTDPADYAPFLANMERILATALAELQDFETQAALWKAEAEAELQAAVADVRQRQAQVGTVADMGRLFSKVFPQEVGDEARP